MESLEAWWRRGAERLSASDDRPVVLACAAVGALAIRSTLPRRGFEDVTALGPSIVARHFWPIAGVAALLAVVPTRWHYRLQSAALAALFVTFELEEEGGLVKNVTTLAVWFASTLLVWKLPLRNDRFRKALIVVVTLSLPLVARYVSFEQGVVLIQFLFASEVLAQKESRSWIQCQRATSALLTMMPPTDLVASRRTGASLLIGAGLIAGGTLGLRAFHRFGPCESSPFFFCAQSLGLSIADLVWLHPRPASLAWAVVRDVTWLANFALQYSVFAGLLNLFGIPMRFITGNMLRVRNLFDYWKTANRWQYELLRTVYLDNFFAIGRGWTAAAGIVLVFMVSGLHHLPGRLPEGESMARVLLGSETRWVVFGILCAITYQYRVYSVRRRLRATMSGGADRSLPRSFDALVGPASLFGVLCVSGLLIAGDEVFGITRPYWVVSSGGPEGVRKARFYRSLEYGGPTRPAERIPQADSGATPALAELGDALYAVWRDESHAELRWSRLEHGSWSMPHTIEGAVTRGSPSIAALGGRLVATWVGGAPPGVEWASFDGGSWSPVGRIEGTQAGAAPSLTTNGRLLYAAWAAADPEEGVSWARFDGAGWTAPKRMGLETEGASPILIHVDGRLHAIWRGKGRLARSLWWTFLEGTSWAPPREVPGVETSSDPGATSFEHRLVVAWRGVGLDTDIQWASFDGAWAKPARTGLATCGRPAISSHHGYLILAWRGREASRCEDPSSYGGTWDETSLYFVDLPRSSSDPKATLGRFVWRNLRTNDPRAAVAFYGQVASWHATAGDATDTFTLAGPRGAFGTFSRISDEDRQNGVRPFWAPAVAVEDVDATVRAVPAAGGRVYVGPKAAKDDTKFAVIADSTGGAFDISSSVGATTLHDSSEPGDFEGSILTTGDGEGALRFYGAIFGWRVMEQRDDRATPDPALEPGWPAARYVPFGVERMELGTMRVLPGQGVSFWLFYIEVEDLDAAIQRAVGAGGELRVGPVVRLDGSRVAELVDPQGAPFGLHESRR
jgi:predicted enzyme related to lactoylglutathione lyase